MGIKKFFETNEVKSISSEMLLKIPEENKSETRLKKNNYNEEFDPGSG